MVCSLSKRLDIAVPTRQLISLLTTHSASRKSPPREHYSPSPIACILLALTYLRYRTSTYCTQLLLHMGIKISRDLKILAEWDRASVSSLGCLSLSKYYTGTGFSYFSFVSKSWF